jgi:RimJ/RimL family protein N-acetyltransferase
MSREGFRENGPLAELESDRIFLVRHTPKALLAPIEHPNSYEEISGYPAAPKVGSAGFKGASDDDGIVEIAYGIFPEFERRGYTTKVAHA